MPFAIRSTLTALVAIQQALSITDPAAVTVKKAWPSIPPSDNLLPDLPCFMNFARPLKISHHASSRSQRWSVRSQLFVFDAQADRNADIVLALITKYIDALSDAQTINGAGVVLTDSSGGETPLRLEYGGKFFIGAEFTLVLEVPLEVPPAVGP